MWHARRVARVSSPETSVPIQVLANEDTLLRTHCCRHKCFPVCPRAQHLLRTQILFPEHENVSYFVQKHFVSATNVSQFAQPKKHHGQQCVRNNVSSFTRALSAERLGSLSTRNMWLQRKMTWLVKFMNWHFHYFPVRFLPENIHWLISNLDQITYRPSGGF